MSIAILSMFFGVATSLTGRAWRWRGAICSLGQLALGDDIVRQLLMSRGVEARMTSPGIASPPCANFCPIRHNRDMDVAAERIADAICEGEKITDLRRL